MAIVKKSTDVTEVLPQSGGSYLRNDDGSLTQVEGPDFTPVAPTPSPASAPVNKPITNAQE